MRPISEMAVYTSNNDRQTFIAVPTRGLWSRVLIAVPNKAQVEVAQNETTAKSTTTSISHAVLLVIETRKAEKRVNA